MSEEKSDYKLVKECEVIKGISDVVEAKEIPGNDLIIEAVLEADHDISTNPNNNTAGIAAKKAL